MMLLTLLGRHQSFCRFSSNSLVVEFDFTNLFQRTFGAITVPGHDLPINDIV